MRKRYMQRPVGRRELRSLVTLARAEEQAFFERNPHLIRFYKERLLAIALCQGAALQHIGIGYGVNDFDVHFFYRQSPRKPRLSRAVRRISTDVGSFRNVAVDFIRTVIPTFLTGSARQQPAMQIELFLHSKPTSNARHLAAKAVVGLWPLHLFGRTLWRPRRAAARAECPWLIAPAAAMRVARGEAE